MGGVAGKVLEQLGGLLEDDRYSVVDLLESVEAELVTLGVATRRNQSDLIRITVSAASPQKAAAIADAWSREYVDAVNLLYQQVPQDLIDSVQNKLGEAKATYEDSQKRLETFLAENPIGQLDRKANSILEEIASLHELSKLRSYSLRHRTLHTNIELIDDYYVTKRRLTNLLEDVRSLRFEIGKGGEAGSVSNETAIQLIKIQAYAMTNTLPEGIRIHVDKIRPIHTDAAKQRTEIDRLSEALKIRIEKIDKDVQRLAETVARENREIDPYEITQDIDDVEQAIERQGKRNQCDTSEKRSRCRKTRQTHSGSGFGEFDLEDPSERSHRIAIVIRRRLLASALCVSGSGAGGFCVAVSDPHRSNGWSPGPVDHVTFRVHRKRYGNPVLFQKMRNSGASAMIRSVRDVLGRRH